MQYQLFCIFVCAHAQLFFLTADGHAHLRAAAFAVEPLRQQLGFLRLERIGEQNALGNVFAKLVEPREEGNERRAVEDFICAEVKGLAVGDRAAADKQDRHRTAQIVAVHADDIALGIGRGDDMLLVTELADIADAVTVFGRALKFEIFRSRLHLLLEQPEQAAVVAAQQVRSLVVALAQLLRRHPARAADADALADMVIQAGAALADVLRELSVTARQSQRLAHGIDDAQRRPVGGKRSEILRAVAVVPRRHRQRGIVALRKLDIGVALRVLKLDVIVRHVLLDERIFQHQRFQLGGGMVDLEMIDGGDHLSRFARRNAARCKIAGHTVLQRLRFADVNHAVEFIAHDVHTGRGRKQSRFLEQLGLLHSIHPLRKHKTPGPIGKMSPDASINPIHTKLSAVQVGKDKVDEPVHSFLLVHTVGDDCNLLALRDPQRQNAEQTFRIGSPVAVFNPYGAFIRIGLLYKKGCRSCVQPDCILNRYGFGKHR